ncbi:methyl-accepting chemotaxis protein [Heyndrickxia oleronia]|uniref:methyl-accepting chemotaxis protein n=1 Tax=Heyndrickxia oleronia TaxID=38875 RepID=UPI002041AA24|nr:methyl-accepting chemotaxis protein [Heyndrickxia oleronia]MCM3239635.1 methyl-accepting chemotaxis protein [Heyndrickxia oleronia]
MIKSIKFKFIFIISLLLIIAFTVMIGLTTLRVSEKNEESVISETDRLVDDLNYSIQLYFNQYEKSLQQMSSYEKVGQYGYNEISSKKAEILKDNDIKELFDGYLNTYKEATNIYFATTNKKMLVFPAVQLPSDFDPTLESWYKNAINTTGRVVWTEPYKDKTTNEFVITGSKAVIKKGMIVGVIGVDIKLSAITNRVSNMKIGYKGVPFIVNGEGKSIIYKDSRGEDVTKYPYFDQMMQENKGHGIIHYQKEGDNKVLVYSTNLTNRWRIGAIYSQKDLMVMARDIQLTLLVLGIITLFISICILTFISIRITKPLGQLKKAMGQLSDGDLSAVSIVKSKDEIGDLSHHFNTMVNRIREIILRVNASVFKVKESAESLSATSEETNASSEQVAVAVNEIAEGASRSAEEAEAANNNSAQLSTQINEIYQKSGLMSDVAKKASEMNDLGINKMNDLTDSFRQSEQFIQSMSSIITVLSHKVKTIETVIQVITNLSSQTNLLALNASIEAARAGEHGKGFAVVAEEVRKLAEQSVHATNQVKDTILDIQVESQRAVEEMDRTNEIFMQQSQVVLDTNDTFNAISTLINDLQDSIHTVYSSVEAVSDHKEELVHIIQSMAAMSEQTAAACEEVGASTEEQLRAIQTVAQSSEDLKGLSYDLQEIVSYFKVKNK